MDKIFTHIPIIDTVLGGGLEGGSVTEFSGWPWSLILKLMHRLIANFACDGRILVLYNQLFGGLNPYLIDIYIRKNGHKPKHIYRNILIRRSFRNEDMISALEKLNEMPFNIILIVDPYLHIELPRHSLEMTIISSRLWQLSSRNHTAIILNRAYKEKPYGGNFHHHIVHTILFLKLIATSRNDKVIITRIKHPYLPVATVITDIDSLLEGNLVKYLPLTNWLFP